MLVSAIPYHTPTSISAIKIEVLNLKIIGTLDWIMQSITFNHDTGLYFTNVKVLFI